jgi:hypothetical protein
MDSLATAAARALVAGSRSPLSIRKRPYSGHRWTSQKCRYCCKSPKLARDNFPAIRRSDRRPPIWVVSITLSRSPVSLSSGDEVPHIFTRKLRLQPGEFLITSAKRLLQQYLPCVDGSKLARLFFTFAGWSLQSCVRPVSAAHKAAGHNALRRSGPGQKPAFESAALAILLAPVVLSVLKTKAPDAQLATCSPAALISAIKPSGPHAVAEPKFLLPVVVLPEPLPGRTSWPS